MSQQLGPGPTAADTAAKISPPHLEVEGVQSVASLEEPIEKRVDEIEMIGEEEAAGWHHTPQSEITPGMRYLHSSRTIHQLVTDRNRAVGLYLAVASLLWTASTALLNAKPDNLRHLMVPMEKLQRWCLPVTFGTLTVLALFVSFLLIRTRIGLIYEVAKMNVLLGLPVGRVKRVNPLSIFFLMHAVIALAGGASATLFTLHLLARGGWGDAEALMIAVPVGVVIAGLLVLSYIITVRVTTADRKLQGTPGT